MARGAYKLLFNKRGTAQLFFGNSGMQDFVPSGTKNFRPHSFENQLPQVFNTKFYEKVIKQRTKLYSVWHYVKIVAQI